MSLFCVLHFDICSGRRLTFGADDVGRRCKQFVIIWIEKDTLVKTLIISRKHSKFFTINNFLGHFLGVRRIFEPKISDRQTRNFHFHSGENLKLTRKEWNHRAHMGQLKISFRISARIAGQLRAATKYPSCFETIRQYTIQSDRQQSFFRESFLWRCAWRFSFSSLQHEKRNSKGPDRVDVFFGSRREIKANCEMSDEKSRESDLLNVGWARAGMDLICSYYSESCQSGELDGVGNSRNFQLINMINVRASL